MTNAPWFLPSLPFSWMQPINIDFHLTCLHLLLEMTWFVIQTGMFPSFVEIVVHRSFKSKLLPSMILAWTCESHQLFLLWVSLWTSQPMPFVSILVLIPNLSPFDTPLMDRLAGFLAGTRWNLHNQLDQIECIVHQQTVPIWYDLLAF